MFVPLFAELVWDQVFLRRQQWVLLLKAWKHIGVENLNHEPFVGLLDAPYLLHKGLVNHKSVVRLKQVILSAPFDAVEGKHRGPHVSGVQAPQNVLHLCLRYVLVLSRPHQLPYSRVHFVSNRCK